MRREADFSTNYGLGRPTVDGADYPRDGEMGEGTLTPPCPLFFPLESGGWAASHRRHDADISRLPNKNHLVVEATDHIID